MTNGVNQMHAYIDFFIIIIVLKATFFFLALPLFGKIVAETRVTSQITIVERKDTNLFALNNDFTHC